MRVENKKNNLFFQKSSDIIGLILDTYLSILPKKILSLKSNHLMSQKTLPFKSMSDDEVRKALAENRIGLTVEEARKIQEMLGRPPTVTEATIWGIQGSEHCSYKSSRRFLKNLPTTGKHVILGPKEDSGIVAITDGPTGRRWGLVVSHESHNHPSQVVPYEGAATGVGGCVRDVLCMGAHVIAVADPLRFGEIRRNQTKLIAAGVI